MPNWNEVLKEIKSHEAANDFVRRKYLSALHKKTDRNIIAYYSGWLSKPEMQQSDINDEDKNGFMMTVHGMDRSKGLDLILHTPGGSIASTHSIVDYLQQMFQSNIRAVVPQIAMSAGTMMACCCREILMSKHSNLGPIDPHLHNTPAYGVIKEFKRACREIKKDPSKIVLWQQIIGQYRPTFLSQCQNAITWSNRFVREQLEKVMFAGLPDAKDKAKHAVHALSDYTKNKSHNRHIHKDEARAMGLNVLNIEDDKEYQDLLLTVHHCYMHIFMNGPAYKGIENHMGIGIFKNVSVQLGVPSSFGR